METRWKKERVMYGAGPREELAEDE